MCHSSLVALCAWRGIQEAAVLGSLLLPGTNLGRCELKLSHWPETIKAIKNLLYPIFLHQAPEAADPSVATTQ